MPKIVHAADFHLDSAFGGLPVEKARERRRESRDLLRRLADLARQEEAEVLLLSGDLFDGERVFPETLERMGEVLDELNIPVFIAPGNHDPYTPISPYALRRWPENVHIFSKDTIEGVALPDLGDKTFSDYMTNVSTVLANDSLSNQTALKTNVTVLNGLQDSRDSVSGVSLDEEASNMMTYLSAYNAASRLMTALDEALNTLINNTGLVGR